MNELVTVIKPEFELAAELKTNQNVLGLSLLWTCPKTQGTVNYCLEKFPFLTKMVVGSHSKNNNKKKKYQISNKFFSKHIIIEFFFMHNQKSTVTYNLVYFAEFHCDYFTNNCTFYCFFVCVILCLE